MATDPITAARYPAESDSGDVALWMERGVNDLSSQVVPRFASTSARDNAYSAAITAGTISSIPNGAVCSVNGQLQKRVGGAWYDLRPRNFWRSVSVTNQAISNGGANETGQSPFAALASFTLHEAARVLFTVTIRMGPDAPSSGAALGYLKVDGNIVSNPSLISRTNDETFTSLAGLDLSAGSHSIAVRVEAFGGDVVWNGANVIFFEGAAE